MGQSWIVALAAVVAVVAVTFVWRQASASRRRRLRERALACFPRQLLDLESQFLAAAAATGKPRGLRWTSCRLEGPPSFAEDRVSKELYALVAATVSFEAIEGGDMEEVEAVGNLRAATAVFVHRDGEWTTDGRTVFNLEPAGALHHYRASLVGVSGSGN